MPMVGRVDPAIGEDLTYLRRMAGAGRAGPPLGGLLMAAFGGFVGAGASLLWLGEALSVTMGHHATALGIGFVVFAAVACSSGGHVSRRRLAIAAAASAATILAQALFYAVLMRFAVAMAIRQGGGDLSDLPRALIALAYIGSPVFLLVGGLAVLGVVLVRLRQHPASIAPGNVVAGAVWSGGMLAMGAIITVFIVQGQAQRGRISPDAEPMLRDAVTAAGILSVPAMFWVIWALAWWVWALATARRWPLPVAAASIAIAIWYARTMDLLATSVVGLVLLVFVPGLVLMREEHARKTGGAA